MEETTTTCPNCNQEPCTCTWFVCGGCGERTSESDLCENCYNCSTCCDCSSCDRCGTNVNNTCLNCDRCGRCCTCEQCRSCNTACDNTCSNCRYCEECCECHYCNRCHNRHSPDYMCGDCDYCQDCCECESESEEEEEDRNVIFFEQKPIFYPCGKMENKEIKSRRYIACELEFASISPYNEISEIVRKWGGSIVYDGSLPYTGFEIRTAPAAGDVFCRQIRELCQQLRFGNAEVDKSCGFHVHIDARDFSWWEIRRLILIYAKIEDALFECVTKSRRNSEFCERCGTRWLQALSKVKHNPKQAIIISNYPEIFDYKHKQRKNEIERVRRSNRHETRYRALNIHSWMMRKTIECRLAAGTANPDKIIPWASLWANLLDEAVRNSEAQINQFPDNSEECLRLVSPNEAVWKWLQERKEQFIHTLSY